MLLDGMEGFNALKFKLALHLGANPNISVSFKKGYHLVTRCARSGDLLLLEMLLKYKGNPNAVSSGFGDLMPLHMAVLKKNKYECIDLLIRYGANPDAVFYLTNIEGKVERTVTALELAKMHGKVERIRRLEGKMPS